MNSDEKNEGVGLIGRKSERKREEKRVTERGLVMVFHREMEGFKERERVIKIGEN